MKSNVLIIGVNLGDSGSTGSMMIAALRHAEEVGFADWIACVPHHVDDAHYYSFAGQLGFFDRLIRHFFIYKKRIIADGFFSKQYAKNICKMVKTKRREYSKVIVHLHNLHHCELDVPYLLRGLKTLRVKVFYTLHDCWAFTARCYYYGTVPCDRWEKGCRKCVLGCKRSSLELRAKIKPIITNKDLTLLPCSHWLERELNRSLLRDVPKQVVHGGTSMPLYEGGLDKSALRGLLNLPKEKKILITVSAYWNEWKGIQFLNPVARLLPDDYVFLVIGPCQLKNPDVKVHLVGSVPSEKLCTFLYASDCFVSVTQCDNLPLVLMEAQLCGLPIVGFGHGGTPEEISEKTGIMVGLDNDIHKLVHEVRNVIEQQKYAPTEIIEWGKQFTKDAYAKRMLAVYQNES